MEYFKKVYINHPQNIELGAPLALIDIAIIKDTVDDEVLLRNVVLNNSNESIIAFAISYSVKNVFGETINNDKHMQHYIYQDIEIKPDEIFGNKISIGLPHDARQAVVKIEKVVFKGGKVWSSNQDNIVTIQPQREIEASDEYLTKCDDNSIIPKYYYVENDSCWQCTCGQPNKITTSKCCRCSRLKQNVKQFYNNAKIKEAFLSYLLEKKTADENIINTQQKSDIVEHNTASSESKELVVETNIQNGSSDGNDKGGLTNSKAEAIHSDNNSSKWRTSWIVKIAIVSIIILALATGVFTRRSSKDNSMSVSQYIDLLGTEVKDNNLTISQDLYDKIDKVFLCGYYGTISATNTIDNPSISEDGVVSNITWTSNSSLSKNDYKKFIKTFKNQYIPKEDLKTISEDDNIYNAIDGKFKIQISFSDEKVSVSWKLESKGDPSITNNSDSDSYKKTSGKSYEKSSSSYSGQTNHTCIQCGKHANHSITGLNGTLEWYCDDHWNQMKEMLDYMSK